jgi:hypothetical protein
MAKTWQIVIEVSVKLLDLLFIFEVRENPKNTHSFCESSVVFQVTKMEYFNTIFEKFPLNLP